MPAAPIVVLTVVLGAAACGDTNAPVAGSGVYLSAFPEDGAVDRNGPPRKEQALHLKQEVPGFASHRVSGFVQDSISDIA